MIQFTSIMINIKLSLFIIITAYTKIKITNINCTFRLKKVYLNTYYFVLFSINRKESIMVCIWKSADAAKTKVMKILTPNLNFDHSGKSAFYAVVEFKGP